MAKIELPRKLPGRQDIFSILSEFLDFGGNENRINPIWITEKKLRKNIDRYCDRDPDFSELCQEEDVLAVVWYFLNLALQDMPLQPWERGSDMTLARKHILSHFEEACYHASRSRYISWHDFDSPRETFDAYWEIGRSILINLNVVKEILTSYDPSKSDNLGHYACGVLSLKIREEYYSRTGQGKRTIWGALKAENKKNLRLALQDFGLREAEIERHIFARYCFFEVYQPVGKGNRLKFVEPIEKDYQAAADLYNEKKKGRGIPPEVENGSNVTARDMKKLQENNIRALQRFSKQNSHPSDSSVPLNILVREDKADNSLVERRQRDGQQGKVDAIVAEFLAAKQEDNFLSYSMLVLRYGLDLSEQNTGDILRLNSVNVDQSTISRRLKKARIELVEELRQEFPGEIKSIRSQSEAHFDKSLKQWTDEKQKAIEEGLRDYLSEEIKFQASQRVRQKAEAEPSQPIMALCRRSLNDWIGDRLKISIDFGELSPQIDMGNVNRIEKKLQRVVERIEDLLPKQADNHVAQSISK
ncbi:MAG: hypothetical protein F6J93_13360 [Oscillatoria sp. SIO1A7]|nr:hypothetical protein [Oscillatoria sp. SIO1A7]